MKKIIVLLTILMLVLTACKSTPSDDTYKSNETTDSAGSTESSDSTSSSDTSGESEPSEESEPLPMAKELLLTLEELALYNGKDGQPAYVAVDGIIYDMTNSGPWSGGGHNGFEAGNDLTEAIKEKSPHGVVKLDNVPIVGKLVESVEPIIEEEELSDETSAVEDESNVEVEVLEETAAEEVAPAEEAETMEETPPSEEAPIEDNEVIEETEPEEVASEEDDGLLRLTLQELKAYNGVDGQPAYIAVDGLIYDVTNSSAWSGGGHNNYDAGQDLSEPLKEKSPHGPSKLKNIPQIGIIVE